MALGQVILATPKEPHACVKSSAVGCILMSEEALVPLAHLRNNSVQPPRRLSSTYHVKRAAPPTGRRSSLGDAQKWKG